MRRFIYENEYGKSIEFSPKSEFRLTKITGLSLVKVELSEASGDLQVGSEVTNQKALAKTITFDGDFKESYKNRKRLIDVIAPTANAKLRVIDEENGLDIYIDGMPSRTPDISESKVYQKFQFEFYAPYPYWRTKKKEIYDFYNYVSNFHFPKSFSPTIAFRISSREVRNIVNVINHGTLVTGFKLIMRASAGVQAPAVTNVKTQEKIKMNDSFMLQVGDILTIYNFDNDLRIEKNSKGIITNAFGDLDIDHTDFFQLNVGDNVLQFDASVNADKLDVTIEFDEVLAGI